ncbi:MAG TPA: hypothetical protein VNX25_05765 [Verrucomicrobiae bacterium]|nr:hypothetical protein [Verrucomicrobiae bacterium]
MKTKYLRAVLSLLCLAITACSGGVEWLPGSDSTPDKFAFESRTDVLPGEVVTSTPVQISGLGMPADVTVENGQVSINGGAFIGGGGTIKNGQTLQVRHTAAEAGNTVTTTTVTVGGFGGRIVTFSSTTGPDDMPDRIVLASPTPRPEATDPGQLMESAVFTITGIDPDVTLPIAVENGFYTIGDGEPTDQLGEVRLWDKIIVSHVAATTPDTSTVTRLNLGRFAAFVTYSSRTAP